VHDVFSPLAVSPPSSHVTNILLYTTAATTANLWRRVLRWIYALQWLLLLNGERCVEFCALVLEIPRLISKINRTWICAAHIPKGGERGASRRT
jgi:hypothetical protein